MNDHQKFERCLVLSGGGSRFAYYLGIHAAAEACQKAPDLLLASCGGAIAGAIIQGLPDSYTRKQWVLSRKMYDYLHHLQVAPHVRLFPQLLKALSRYMACYTKLKGATRIPDLYSDYLVDFPPTIPLPPLSQDGPAIAIVGGRLMFEQCEIGTLRNGRPLFTEVLFGNERIRGLLDNVSSPVSSKDRRQSAIATEVEVMTGVPVADAVRISLSDIFYTPCQPYGVHHYCGGVIDLYPLELARALAHDVTMELKPPFNRYVAIPALRAVFGFDGNERLRHVHDQLLDVRIDTSDMAHAIPPSLIKRMQLLVNRIMVSPPSYDEYVSIVERQWQYGFSRAMEGYKQKQANLIRPRVCNRQNWSKK